MSVAPRLLLATDAVGGMWTYTAELARALPALGIEPVIAVLGPPPGRDRRREVTGIRLIETGLPLDWTAQRVEDVCEATAGIAALAEKEDADLVQVGSAALLGGMALDRPVVAVQHSCVASWWTAVRGSELPEDFRWRRDLVGRGLRQADAVVAPTAAFARQIEQLYGLDHPVRAVHNGRRAWVVAPAEQGDFVFTAGRLWDEGKGIATLDAAARKVQLRFVAAGPTQGPNGARGMFANLDLPGELGEASVAAILACRPIFASAALYEPFGLSVLEAAQAGCALVLADIPTFRELWDGTALFAAADDSDAFAAAIARLAASRRRRVELGEAARRRSRRYTPDAMAASMVEIYRALLPARQATARPQLALAGAA